MNQYFSYNRDTSWVHGGGGYEQRRGGGASRMGGFRRRGAWGVVAVVEGSTLSSASIHHYVACALILKPKALKFGRDTPWVYSGRGYQQKRWVQMLRSRDLNISVYTNNGVEARMRR
ncbi:hypothetical protein Bbelb_082500 [Branchiostoma belcheri]|nr:hypothetical protein Bbelb_082500 [Branchiostoma belcheri]